VALPCRICPIAHPSNHSIKNAPLKSGTKQLGCRPEARQQGQALPRLARRASTPAARRFHSPASTPSVARRDWRRCDLTAPSGTRRRARSRRRRTTTGPLTGRMRGVTCRCPGARRCASRSRRRCRSASRCRTSPSTNLWTSRTSQTASRGSDSRNEGTRCGTRGKREQGERLARFPGTCPASRFKTARRSSRESRTGRGGLLETKRGRPGYRSPNRRSPAQGRAARAQNRPASIPMRYPGDQALRLAPDISKAYGI
jgi:hypothetical protein